MASNSEPGWWERSISNRQARALREATGFVLQDAIRYYGRAGRDVIKETSEMRQKISGHQKAIDELRKESNDARHEFDDIGGDLTKLEELYTKLAHEFDEKIGAQQAEIDKMRETLDQLQNVRSLMLRPEVPAVAQDEHFGLRRAIAKAAKGHAGAGVLKDDFEPLQEHDDEENAQLLPPQLSSTGSTSNKARAQRGCPRPTQPLKMASTLWIPDDESTASESSVSVRAPKPSPAPSMFVDSRTIKVQTSQVEVTIEPHHRKLVMSHLKKATINYPQRGKQTDDKFIWNFIEGFESTQLCRSVQLGLMSQLDNVLDKPSTSRQAKYKRRFVTIVPRRVTWGMVSAAVKKMCLAT